MSRVATSYWKGCARRRLASLRWLMLCALGLLLFLPGAQSFSQPPAQTAPAGASGELAAKLFKRGDLSLSNTTLSQALFTISETWGINIVVGQDVQGNVNGQFKNAPLSEILDSILLANGYSYRPVGQGLVVMKIEALGELNPMFESATILLKAVKPEDVLAGAQLLSSPKGKVLAVPSAKSLLVVDFPDRVAMIKKFVVPLDESAASLLGTAPVEGVQQLQMAQFPVQFAKAGTLKEAIQSLLSKDGKVSSVELENKLVVVDYAASLVLVERMIKLLDVPRQQVRIRAFIYDVSLEDMERLGINWNHALKGRIDANGDPQSVWALDSLQIIPVPTGAPGAAMTFMNLSQNFDITAVIDALNSAKSSRLLADPLITCYDREPGSIQIVTEIPYQQLTQTSGGGNIGTTAFREAGVTLSVLPQIAQDKTIVMQVTPSFSRLAGYTTGAAPQPIIDKREAKTTVRVMNNQTFVIGGLRQRIEVNDHRGIPYLQDIKVVGKLFQSRETSIRESELIVFLTPELVEPTCPGRPREMSAAQEGDCIIEKIPWAQDTPFPHCHDDCDPCHDCPMECLPPGEEIQNDQAPSDPQPNPPVKTSKKTNTKSAAPQKGVARTVPQSKAHGSTAAKTSAKPASARLAAQAPVPDSALPGGNTPAQYAAEGPAVIRRLPFAKEDDLPESGGQFAPYAPLSPSASQRITAPAFPVMQLPPGMAPSPEVTLPRMAERPMPVRIPAVDGEEMPLPANPAAVPAKSAPVRAPMTTSGGEPNVGRYIR